MPADQPLPEDVVNIDLYPIAARNDPRRLALVARSKEALDANQYCVLPEFLTPAALEAASAEARKLRHLAYDNNAKRNCYLQRWSDPGLPQDHSRNIFFESSTRMVAYDLLGENSAIKTLYHWQAMRELIADIVGAEVLYENADPYQPANILCYEDGDRSTWHFDSGNAFTVTLMLQAPEEGGAFEIVPNTRSDTDPREDYLRAVLHGERAADAVEVAREPGALCIFRGCNSLHRVAPVCGEKMRLMAVFVYENEPGVIGDPEVNATIYGPRIAANT